jgi:hypothetical protein
LRLNSTAGAVIAEEQGGRGRFPKLEEVAAPDYEAIVSAGEEASDACRSGGGGGSGSQRLFLKKRQSMSFSSTAAGGGRAADLQADALREWFMVKGDDVEVRNSRGGFGRKEGKKKKRKRRERSEVLFSP